VIRSQTKRGTGDWGWGQAEFFLGPPPHPDLAQSLEVSNYISPEELNGKRGDARSDIFALSVILYEIYQSYSAR
jgi:hypothetical protein